MIELEKTINIIHDIVCEFTGLNIGNTKQSRDYVKARVIYYKICSIVIESNETSYSALNTAIARFIFKDRTTLLHGLENFADLIVNDEHHYVIYGKALRAVKQSLLNYNLTNYKRKLYFDLNKLEKEELLKEVISLKYKLKEQEIDHETKRLKIIRTLSK